MLDDEERDYDWKLEFGFYPGILLGMRSYREDGYTIHVLYFPFVEFALTVYN
jgi:hypothetical protein